MREASLYLICADKPYLWIRLNDKNMKDPSYVHITSMNRHSLDTGRCIEINKESQGSVLLPTKECGRKAGGAVGQRLLISTRKWR